jgi:serine/threonine protein kinase
MQRFHHSHKRGNSASVTTFLLRDIKPANLLLSKGTVKIGDFGFAKKNLTKRMRNASAVGTPLYWPLQILKSESYTSKCDIWAVGFIFY